MRRVKEGTSAVLLQSGLDENWWADSMEMLHLSAKRDRFVIRREDAQMRDVLGNHLKDLLFHLVHWLTIILSLRKTSQESVNLERKSYLDCSSDTLCPRVELGMVTYWLQTLRSWKRWTHMKSDRKDSMRKR